PEALKIQDRIRQSRNLLDADQQRVAELTGALAQAKEAQKEALQDELGLAQSQLDLDKDELDEANQDLTEAGGNLQQQIETLQQEHEAQVKAAAAAPAAAKTVEQEHGSVSRMAEWLRLKKKRRQIDDARATAAQKAADLTARHATLAANLDHDKGGIAELAQHTKSAKSAKSQGIAPPVPRVQHSHEDAAALLNRTKLIAADQIGPPRSV